MDHEQLLLERTAPYRRALLDHGVYKLVRDTSSLQIFMQSHVFAVWDFMSLLKALQQRVTCVSVPWLPSRDTQAARLVNEIVLAEESDDLGGGRYVSHFELYLAAMDEMGADRGPIHRFTESMRRGIEPRVALVDLAIPDATREFVSATLETAQHGADHQIAAAFLLGREDLIPAMFRSILGEMEGDSRERLASFREYLVRHVDLDEHTHAPAGRRLLRVICGNDPVRWSEAAETACEAIGRRIQLWDGITAAIESAPDRPRMPGTSDITTRNFARQS
jgi:hypothetical protein